MSAAVLQRQGRVSDHAQSKALAGFLRSATSYWGAMLIVGVSNLGFSLIAARALGPDSYGEFAAILALVNIFLIAGSAVTRTATTVVAASDDPATAAWILRRWTTVGAAAGVAAMLIVGLGSGPIATTLHLQNRLWVWIAAAALVPTMTGAVTTGILQGMRNFRASGAVNLGASLIKLIGLILLLDAGLGVTGASLATLIEITLVWLIALPILLHSLRGIRWAAPITAHADLVTLPAALTVARLVFFNLDILVARHELGPEQAGLFAALAVTGRIIAYGTGALPPVVYPYLVRSRNNPSLTRRYLLLSVAATLVFGLGALSVLALAPSAVVGVLFGNPFSAIAPYVLWYGVAFLLYSLAYMLLHYLLAIESRWVWVYAVAGGFAEVTALLVLHGGIGMLVDVETVFFGVLFALTAVHTVVGLRREARA